MKSHSRSEAIAGFSLLVAVISCIAALVMVPEVRSFLGLSSSESLVAPPADPPAQHASYPEDSKTLQADIPSPESALTNQTTIAPPVTQQPQANTKITPTRQETAQLGQSPNKSEVLPVKAQDGETVLFYSEPSPLSAEAVENNRAIKRYLDTTYEAAREALRRAQEAGKLTKGELVDVKVIGNLSSDESEAMALSPKAEEELHKLAEQVKAEDSALYIEIQGHTDSIGPQESNQERGLNWAESVRLHLNRKYGIPLKQIDAVSYGELMPVTDNSTRAGRSQNRRIAFVIMR